MNRMRLLMDQYRQMESGMRLDLTVALAVALLVVVLLSAANSQVSRLDKRRAAREKDLAEMLVLRQRYAEANTEAQKLANRMAALRPDDSPAKVMEEIGIKGKNTQIKPVKGEEKSGFVEDAAEVTVEGLSANEAVNLIYRLERGNKPVVIKRGTIKTRFDDPAKLDLTLTIALLKQSPTGQR